MMTMKAGRKDGVGTALQVLKVLFGAGAILALLFIGASWSDASKGRKCDAGQREIAVGLADDNFVLAAEGFADVARWCKR